MSRSPLTRAPLRNPGQSVQDEIDRLFLESVVPWIFVVVFAPIWALVEWWRYVTKAPPSPVLVTAAAIGAAGLAAWRIYRIRPEFQRLRLGRDGEIAVAQFLDDHRGEGWHLFHDVPAPGFNVDHVLVSPAGVFAIDTKTYSKPGRGQAIVDYDGSRVLINGRQPDRDPVVQAKAISAWLSDLLLESTSHKFSVQPVVLVPGWFVESPKGAQSHVWVLNPKALPAFIAKRMQVLTPEQVALIASRLTNHVAHWEGSS